MQLSNRIITGSKMQGRRIADDPYQINVKPHSVLLSPGKLESQGGLKSKLPLSYKFIHEDETAILAFSENPTKAFFIALRPAQARALTLPPWFYFGDEFFFA